MKHDTLFEKAVTVKVPEYSGNLAVRFQESQEIVQRAIADNNPYAVCLMLSGGDDSITALQVAIMMGVKIDFIIHGVTGTQLRGCREYVNQVAERTGIKLLEADAGTAFVDYVKRKGFFGIGKDAHKFSYHILKSGPFRMAIARNIRKRKTGRKVLLLNGVRVEESDNRLDNFGDETQRVVSNAPNNIWVNIIHYWTKKECLELLAAENIERSPVARALGRSGECNCGTAQNEADRIAAAQYDADFGQWMKALRRHAIEKFGWDIGQNPNKERLAEIKAEAQKLADYMPMCVGCKARQWKMFE